MAKDVVKIEGLEALSKGLSAKKAIMPKVKDIIRKNGANLSKETQSNMLNQYTGHYEGKKFVKPTGATRKSTTVEISDGGLTATVAPSTKYFPYLEYGTRFMKARPTLGPAFKRISPQFEKDIRKIIEK